MNKVQVTANTVFAIACAIVMNTKSFAEPANLTLLKTEVVAYHDSGEYQKELAQKMAQARDYIDQRIAANARNQHPEKLAIVLDIDETSLSNYDNILARDFSSNPKRIHRDILAANAPAIEPTLALYQDALKHHVAVFFVTGRVSSEYEATNKNLQSAGYRHWSGLYVQPDNYKQTSIVPFKAGVRASITKMGYTVIASIGDQNSDLAGGYAEKTFKLPNPYYHIK